MYNHEVTEKKWQKYWAENKTFKTDAWDFSKPKFYALDMFPYPSGAGLHVGHPEGYTATDVVSRKKRMEGYNVLHPMGFDSLGLPAEQYAPPCKGNRVRRRKCCGLSVHLRRCYHSFCGQGSCKPFHLQLDAGA